MTTVKHALQNTQNDCHQWLSHSFRVNQWLNYSARGGGSLQARGLKGRSWSPKGREHRWCSRPPTRGFRAFKAFCLAFIALNSVWCLDSSQQSGESQRKAAGSQLWGTGSVIRGCGSQIRGAGSWISPQFYNWSEPNSFSAGASPGPHLGSLQRSPAPLVGLRRPYF